MASIRKEVQLSTPPDVAWDAFRDVGAVHTRLARGFVTDCRMDGPDWIVTFADGVVARQLIVNVDDAAAAVGAMWARSLFAVAYRPEACVGSARMRFATWKPSRAAGAPQ